MLIDTHVHLDDSRFDSDREELIKNFKEDQLELVINIGADLETSANSVRLAESYPNIYAAVGIHPHDASSFDQGALEVLRSLAQRPKVLAIGEIGLDYYYDNSPRDKQRYAFKEQIKLAKELDLPIVIHSREASQDTFDILEKHQDGSLRAVLHCFSGSLEMAKEYIKLGFYISLAGPVSFKNAKEPKRVAKEVDLDRLLIETDSPYLTPEPFRGKRNQPAYVRYVAETISQLREMPYQELVEITNRNAKRFFGIKNED